MKRALKFIFKTLLVIVLLIVLLITSLYLPPVQRWAVNKLTAYLEEQTGLVVTIGSVHLAFPLDLSIGQLHVEKAQTDVIDLDLTRLFHRRIGVEAIELSNGSIYTTDLIDALCMEGSVGNFRVEADDIDLRQRRVNVTDVTLDGCVLDIRLRETAEKDTIESEPVDWQINVDKVRIHNSKFKVQNEPPGFMVDVAIREASLDGGDISLSQGAYRTDRVSLAVDSLRYNDLAFRDVELGLNKFFFDSTHLTVAGLDLKTPNSFAQGNVNLDLCALSPKTQGQLKANVQASLSSNDALSIAEAYLPKELATCYPSQPLNIDLFATGNVDSLSLQTCVVTMPSVIDARAMGSLLNLTDSAAIGADLKWDVATMDLSCLNRYLGLSNVHFPKMILHADTRLRQASRLTADAMLLEGKGRAHLKGNIDLRTMTYQADARITDLQLHDFLPHDSLYLFTANAKVSGRGTDMLSPHAKLSAHTSIEHLGYASWNLDSIHADCLLEKGKAMLDISSQNDLLCMHGCVDAAINERKLKAAAFNMDMNHIDLYALHLAGKPLSASMVMHVDGASDFQQTHSLAARIEAMELTTADSIIHPLDLSVDANLTPELIRLKALAGDLSLSVSSDQGLDSLLARFDNFSKELKRQTDSLRIQQDTLRTLLPHLRIELECGQKNPIGNILRHAVGYTFRDLSFHLLSSPEEGLSGNGYMHSLNTGAILLDTIQWRIRQEQQRLSLDAQVANGPKNRIVTFQSRMRVSLTETGAEANLVFCDAKGEKSVDFGLALDLLADGLRARFTPLDPTIAYRRFTLNADNFITLTRSGHLDALVDLLADDGTGLKLYTTPNDEAQQDISLSVNRFNVGELTHVIPFMPDISGFLHGDVHYMQADSTTTVSTEMLVERMTYNGVLLGNIGLNGVYLPNADESHYVDGIITKDGEEILLLNGNTTNRMDRER